MLTLSTRLAMATASVLALATVEGAGAFELSRGGISINQGNAISSADVDQNNNQTQNVSVQNSGQNNGAGNAPNHNNGPWGSDLTSGIASATGLQTSPSGSSGNTCVGCGNIGSPQTSVQIASPSSSADGGTGIIGDNNDHNTGAVDLSFTPAWAGGGAGAGAPGGGSGGGHNVSVNNAFIAAFQNLEQRDQEKIKRGCEKVNDSPRLYDRETVGLCALAQ